MRKFTFFGYIHHQHSLETDTNIDPDLKITVVNIDHCDKLKDSYEL